MLPGSRQPAGRVRPVAKPEARAAAAPAPPAGARAEVSLSLSDFLLPEAPPPEKAPPYYLFRQRQSRWSKEQVERYWIPPRDVAAEVLRKANDKAMDKFFESIP